MTKIIGFTKKVDGFQTRTGFMSSVLFTNACKTTAKRLGMEINELVSKRQAGKFLKGEGIVFNTAINGEGEE